MSLKAQTGTGTVSETSTTPDRVCTPTPRPEPGTQWPLIPPENPLEGGGTTPRVFRPIHYLGSKLRMVDEIVEAVDKVDPSKARVCDLFAGSGTVSGRACADSKCNRSRYPRVFAGVMFGASLPNADDRWSKTDAGARRSL